MEKQAPVFDCGVEGDGFLAGGTCKKEGVLVNASEKIEIAGKGAAEGGNDGLLLSESIGSGMVSFLL